MSLIDAVISIGPIPPDDAGRSQKKRYSELLSNHLAVEIAEGLRAVGFPNVKPLRGKQREKEFQGGLGSKRVDVSYADDRHGLLMAVSIKSINFPKFGKNLKNRFSDLCTEAITLHMRFPYSVVCALFAFPLSADSDSIHPGKTTFKRAIKLFATISGREEYTSPGEKFENITMMLYEPVSAKQPSPKVVRLIDSESEQEMTEEEYYQMVRTLYNARNPHAIIGEEEFG